MPPENFEVVPQLLGRYAGITQLVVGEAMHHENNDEVVPKRTPHGQQRVLCDGSESGSFHAHSTERPGSAAIMGLTMLGRVAHCKVTRDRFFSCGSLQLTLTRDAMTRATLRISPLPRFSVFWIVPLARR